MRRSLLSLSILAGLLTGCGGGSSDSTVETLPSGTEPPTANPTTVVKSGVITGFGSVYIDGKRYTTNTTTITVNGNAGAAIDALKVGMKIQLTSDDDDDENSNDASATSITYDSDVGGIIQSIDRSAGQIQIAGVTMVYDDLTHFIGTSVTTLNVGDRIEASGYAMADGSFYATYVELENDLPESEPQHITGVISELETTAQTFFIGSMQVDYSQAVPEGELANALQVKLEGVITNNVFVASELEVRNSRFEEQDDIAEAEVEGVITAVDAAAQTLEIYGQTYAYNNATQFEYGAAENLAPGVVVELNLAFNNGEQTVTKIEFKQLSVTDGKLKGMITALDNEAGSFTVNNTVFYVNTQTRFEDDNDQYIALNSLQLNDLVEVVYQVEAGQNIVLRLEREDDNEYYEESEVEGYLTAFTENSVTLSGLTIAMSVDAVYLLDDRRVTLAEFIAALVNGVILEVRGNYDANGSFTANKFELELEDDNSDDDSDGGSDDGSDDNSDDNDDGQDNDGATTGTYLEIEGRVSAVGADNRFTVNGYEVDISGASELELNGRRVSAAEFMAAISAGTIVEVEGSLNEAGVLLAREAEIETSDDNGESDDD
ncbi:MAG TPA: hypothetical protein DGF36_13145 [Alteromonas sp.]|nr:hypothetical protein [Alteromonas sp.]